MEDRGSNEIEQRIEDEGKRISRGGHRISQGGHNKEGEGRGGAGVQKPVKTIEDVRNRNTAGKLLIYNLTTISILISVTGLKTLL